mmetsp:Transcript_17125/g.42799  ORF Transcript_17125/g.42799 Transcript_17125/m.42799 type:complete len:210 (-) Transcript_17125:1034-1663(-)
MVLQSVFSSVAHGETELVTSTISNNVQTQVMVVELLPTSRDYQLLIWFEILNQRNKYVQKVKKKPVQGLSRRTRRVGQQGNEFHTRFACHVIPFQKFKWAIQVGVARATKGGKASQSLPCRFSGLRNNVTNKTESLCELLVGCVAIGQLFLGERKSPHVRFQIQKCPKGKHSENWRKFTRRQSTGCSRQKVKGVKVWFDFTVTAVCRYR